MPTKIYVILDATDHVVREVAADNAEMALREARAENSTHARRSRVALLKDNWKKTQLETKWLNAAKKHEL